MSDSVLDRFGIRPTVDQESSRIDVPDDFGAFGWLRGIRDRALTLELRKKDGSILGVGYAWIDRISFDPSEGITLSVSGQKIVIRGRNLNGEVQGEARLFRGICQHRVPWVQEADEPAIMESQGQGVLIEQIEW
tara:strand:- start:118038 stop:118439 length:402 start_codon:yes stop_codon:yes gene_type:complete